jgi:hypothetical protein
MQAAEHGADFPMAKKVRSSMSHNQMHDFAVGSEAGKPEHAPMLKGDHPSIIHSNKTTLMNGGMSEADATKHAVKASRKGHPNRHKNLGKWLHPKGSKGQKGRDLEIFGKSEGDNDGDE